MANHAVNKSYSDTLRVLEVTDPGHADTFNPLFKQLVNNDAFLKMTIEALNQNVIELTQKNHVRGFVLDVLGSIGVEKVFGTSTPLICSKRLKYTRSEVV